MENKEYKIIFAGTSNFGIPTLEKILNEFSLVAVVTQPDKSAGRKQKLTKSAIKTWALEKNIPVWQPAKIIEIKDQMKDLTPDLLIVTAYGQIIPLEILTIPKFGSINLHGSILPKYRGATPIHTAILNGDETTGITLLKMDEKMDHGPIITRGKINIQPNETFLELYEKMAKQTAELVSQTLPEFLKGNIQPSEQNHEQASFTKMFTRDDARIDWTNPAPVIVNQIRALNPEPGVWTTMDGKSVKILEAEVAKDDSIELPGKIFENNKKLVVKTGRNSIQINKLQMEGKKTITGFDFLNSLKKENKLFI